MHLLQFFGLLFINFFPYLHATSYPVAQYIIFKLLYYGSDRLNYKLAQKVQIVYWDNNITNVVVFASETVVTRLKH